MIELSTNRSKVDLRSPSGYPMAGLTHGRYSHWEFFLGSTDCGRPQKSPVPDLEENQTLSLLFDLSRKLTAILERDELFQRLADRVKKVVEYHLFNLMVWNDSGAQLECAFTKHYEEAISVQLAVPLNKGITGHAAGNRCAVRVGDVRLDHRYIEFPHSDNVRSELVVPPPAAKPPRGSSGSRKRPSERLHSRARTHA